MAWYRAGTVSVTNGSPTVTGTGTAFVANVSAGEGFVGPDGRPYEIAEIVSNTVLTLASNYLSASASGQPYWIAPTQSALAEATAALAEVTESYQEVRDGPGQGLFADGSAAAPGVRFANDQDTGIRRSVANGLTLVSAGADVLTAVSGNIGIGTTSPSFKLDVVGPSGTTPAIRVNRQGTADLYLTSGRNDVYGLDTGSTDLMFATEGTIRGRITSGGFLSIGSATASNHKVAREGISEGATIFSVDQGTANSILVDAVTEQAFNATGAAVKIGRNSSTGRSVNAGGTINASGADYAEYVAKSETCGTIAKGEVCGIDANGQLTKTWAEALCFVVKSTDPNLVGGDNWAQHLGMGPTAPAPLRPRPVAPQAPEPFAQSEPVQGEGESETEFAVRHYQWAISKAQAEEAQAYFDAAQATYPAMLAEWLSEKAAYDDALATYEATLPDWQDAMEEARHKVDRIAFCGQVPVNVDAGVLADCEAALDDGEAVYLVAVSNGGGIGCAAIRESAMTLPDYMRRLGAVWRIEDGRPIIDVQHG